MSDFLDKATKQRREDVWRLLERVSLETMQRAASEVSEHRSLMDRLQSQGPGQKPAIIAEMKKASPSAGVIVEKYDPVAIARQYEQGGAIALSVVTEPHFFMGSNSHLENVRKSTKLPILRKDFICEIYQLYESAVLGVDVVLLIAAALDFHVLRDLYVVALAIGLEVIVEVHTQEELEMVLPLAKTIIGVNNRDLRTLKIDLSVSRELASMLPRDRLAISESGIRTRRDIEEMEALGYRGFLIGESLLRSSNPAILLRNMLAPPRPPTRLM